MHCVNAATIDTRIFQPCLNIRSVIQCSGVIEIRNGIIFDLYAGMPLIRVINLTD